MPSAKRVDADSKPMAGGRKDGQRLEFIEFRLYWEGRINRSDLSEVFGISTPQATIDLKRYQELAPGNMEYDLSRKAYVTGKRFRPRLTTPDGNRYLAQLMLVAAGLVDKTEVHFGQTPPFDIVPELNRPVDTGILQRVVRALQDRRRIRIRYQSLTSPEPTTRWVFPCALAYNGLRWHVRAFCHLRNAYRDFILGKILEVTGEEEEKVDIPEDVNWEHTVEVEIGASQELTPDQRTAVEHDYGMEGGKCTVKVRRSLLQYFLEANGLTGAFECDRYQDWQAVAVLNQGDVERELGIREGNQLG